MSDNVTNLRKFHNWVKRRLIHDTADFVRKQHSNIQLLDLAVGRGGDMNKWYEAKIYKVVGFDIDEDSVKGKNGAISRYRFLVNQAKRQKTPYPNYRFYVLDLSQPESTKIVAQTVNNNQFQIISCQFAIHYFFKTQQTLETFVHTVSKHLAQGGFFITTCMDGEKIDQLLKKDGVIDRKIYKIEKQYDKFEKPYGNTVLVDLGTDADKGIYFKEPSMEYLVHVTELKRLLEKEGIQFVGAISFEEWYNIYMKDDGRHPLSDLQKEFSFLNMSMVFQKIEL